MKIHWLALQLPHLALDLQTRNGAVPRSLPLAIGDGDARRPRLLDVNPAAERLGICPGMSSSAAQGLAGSLRVIDRDPRREVAALERLAAWSYQYSSAVSIDAAHHGLLLESGGSERLLGDSEALAQQLTAELQPLGYHARAGTGPTPEAARLAARRGLNFADLDALQQALEMLPLDALTFTAEQRDGLERMGFRHVREVLRLPRKALARRLGTDAVDYLDRLLGVRPDPQCHWRPPESFHSGMDLPAEVASSQALLFPLRRLLVELCGVLRGCDRGVQSLTFHFTLRRGTETLTLGLQQPTRDEAHLLQLLKERLEQLRLPQPARHVALEAGAFMGFDATATGLFVDPGDPDSNPLDPLLERLRARLGNQAVTGLKGVEDHRPEYSWSERRLEEPAECRSMPHRPVWLFPRPKRCRIENYRVLAGPERIESGWWDGDDCRRDYFVVRDRTGSTLWAYREYKPRPGWYLHGLFG
ncbi:MAG: DNA polymerase Y family protein [Pseudomonadota bacterium]